MNWTGLAAVGTTVAFYNDSEASSENALGAGSLDFSLEAGEWEPAETAMRLVPGETVTRSMKALANGSIPFQYTVKTVKTSGDDDFCTALTLVAERDGAPLFDGALLDFLLAPPVVIGEDGMDDWLFRLTLPGGSPLFEGKSCEFRFDVDAWQRAFAEAGSGFNDHEELENLIEGGFADTANISPISDAYVDEELPGTNFGALDRLRIKSRDGGRNRRAFVRFDFHFPAEADIFSSTLRLFMTLAPSTSRTYEAKRVLEAWTERDPGGITWENQPPADAAATDAAASGTTDDTWLSWDVTDDVADFVAETSSNYGWAIGDSEEDSASTKRASLRSREAPNADLRPVLEIAFSAPSAPTTHPVINEVYYHVGNGKGSDGANEWVELYNPTAAPVDVTGWKICDNSSCDVIPASAPIPALGFAVISKNGTTWPHWAVPAEAVLIELGSNIGGGLANAGDRVILSDAADAEVDSMSYGSDISELDPSVSTSGRGKSLARIIKGYDADAATDWIINATPNPGTNPSDSGVEVIRFTSEGAEVADLADGLDVLPRPDDEDADETEEPVETALDEGAEETNASLESATTTESGADEFATSTPDTLDIPGIPSTSDGSEAAEIGEDAGAETTESPDAKFDEEEAPSATPPADENGDDPDAGDAGVEVTDDQALNPPAEEEAPAENPVEEPASSPESEPVVEPAPELEQASESAPAPEPPPAPELAPSSENSGEAASGE